MCGIVQEDCNPPYPVEYKRGAAIQFFGDPPADGSNFTRDCEVIGVGPPMITLFDPNDSFNGINITHYGVPSVAGDPFRTCPFDPLTGAPAERQVTIALKCNPSAVINPKVISVGEWAPCKYEIILESYKGCGCEPNCNNMNCGSDGCGGYCGGVGNGGECPNDSVCTDMGVCCKPDCDSRQCGNDGCGGSCGTCADGFTCTRYQQCTPSNILPSPSPYQFPTNYITTTGGPDYFAAYAGGIVSVGAVFLGFTMYQRVRQNFGTA